MVYGRVCPSVLLSIYSSASIASSPSTTARKKNTIYNHISYTYLKKIPVLSKKKTWLLSCADSPPLLLQQRRLCESASFLSIFFACCVDRITTTTYPFRERNAAERTYSCVSSTFFSLMIIFYLFPRCSSTSRSARNRPAESCFGCSTTWCHARRRTFASSRRDSTVLATRRVVSIGSFPTCVLHHPQLFLYSRRGLCKM